MTLCEGDRNCNREAVHDMTIVAFDQERQVMVCQRCAEKIMQEQESEDEDDYDN